MKIVFNGNVCIVTREPTDPRFYGIVGAKGESRFLYHLKNYLNNRGYDLIKKRMYKDGHMVDDLQQYLRTRSKKSKFPYICLYNNHWAINGLDEDFNKGEAVLSVEHNIFD